MKKFEYRVLYLSGGSIRPEFGLTELGRDGWEAVCMANGDLLLKREVREPVAIGGGFGTELHAVMAELRTHCRRGHRYTASTVRLKLRVVKGVEYSMRNCLRCQAVRERARYRCDEVFREMHKTRERERARRIRAAQLEGRTCQL